MSEARAPSRVSALDGVRGFAVLLVMGYHCEFVAGSTFTRVFSGGWVGVDVFFVLSGYLITTRLLNGPPLGEGRVLRSFYRRRIRRLGPAAALLLAVWLVSSAAGLVPVTRLGDTPRPGSMWLALAPVVGLATLGYNWWLAYDRPSPIGMGHLWSLTIEEQFYLAWPGLMCVLFRTFSDARRKLITCCAAGAAVAVTLSLYASITGRRDWAYFGTTTRMFGLLLGAAVALAGSSAARSAPRVVRAPIKQLVGIVTISALAVISLTARDTSRALVPLASVATAGLAAALVGVLISDKEMGSRWFAWRWLRWCGKRSYALYLWDAPVVFESQHILGAGFAAAVVSTSVTFCCAAISWHLVESRFLQESRRAGAAARVAAMATAVRPASIGRR